MPIPSNARQITASELRKMAEAADGRRDEPLRLVYAVKRGDAVERGSYLVVPKSDEPKYADHDLYDVAQAKTDRVCKAHDIETKTVVEITPHELRPTALSGGSADALFWSESAVEKFFFPYYIRQLPKAKFDLLYRTYMGLDADGQPDKDAPLVIAMSHLPSTDWETLTAKEFGLSPEENANLADLYSIGVIVASQPVQPLPAFLLSRPGGRRNLMGVI